MKTLFFLEIFKGCFSLLHIFFVNICGRKHRSSILDDPRPPWTGARQLIGFTVVDQLKRTKTADVDEPLQFFWRTGEQ